jgi:hypothetical protein
MQMPISNQSLPDFTGNWQANFEKSVLRGAPPKQILNKIEHREPYLDQEILVTQASGDEQRLSFRYKTTGEETTHSLGGRTARIRARWDGAELVIESWLETTDRELHFKDHWSLSDNGETLTMSHRDDDLAGQIVVHDKVPAYAASKFSRQEK